MTKINSKGMQMPGMDNLQNYSKPPMKKPMAKGKKMSPDMIAKRKKSMISNAASKTLGGLYSK